MSETVGKILDMVELILRTGEDDTDDDEIMYYLLEWCKIEMSLQKRKKRKKWIQEWRIPRKQKGTHAFLTKELGGGHHSFKEYIRMDEVQFNKILMLIEKDIKKQDTVLRKAISPTEKLAVTLRYLATGKSLLSTNYQSRLSTSFLSKEIPNVCTAICKNLKNTYMKFPTTTAEWEAIADNFLIKWQFPLCLGAIDGKHILFRPPRKDDALYYNYKGSNSIVLLALVDANCRFIYIDVGNIGQVNDAGVYLESKLRELVNNAETNFPSNKVIGNGRILPYVIVGDDAFPLQKHLLKPYPYETTDKQKQIFNIRISRAKHVAEHAFGILTNRFRILQNKINLSVDKVELITKTCCVLHNFLTDDTNLTFPSNWIALNSVVNTHTNTNTWKEPAEAVRQGFMNYFNGEGQIDWQEK